jgi:hypothetical protein
LDLNKSLAVVAKAMDIMTDHQHLFCSSNILSDIRPIFTDTLKTPSAAGIRFFNEYCSWHGNGLLETPSNEARAGHVVSYM